MCFSCSYQLKFYSIEAKNDFLKYNFDQSKKKNYRLAKALRKDDGRAILAVFSVEIIPIFCLS